MNRIVPILVGLAILGIFAAIVVPQFAARQGSGGASALDGRLTLNLPPTWGPVDSLNPLANIKVGDREADVYLIVVSERKSDIQGDNHSLQKYSQYTRARLVETMSGVRQDGPWQTSVGQHPALRYEIYGKAQDGLNVTYLHTIVETPEYFHQVVGWGEKTGYAKHRGVIRQVADSLREGGE